jgi:hypothetical protein
LRALLAGQPVPRFQPIHHDLLWLPDASGHAGSIAMGLDRVEKRLIQRSVEFEKQFQALLIKTMEIAGYMRTDLHDFPALRRLHQEIEPPCDPAKPRVEA